VPSSQFTQVGYAFGMVLLVPLGDRVEKRRLALAILSVSTLAVVAAGLSPNYWTLLAAVLVIGGTSVVAQVLVPFAADLANDENRGRVVGRVMSGLLFGILLSRSVGSWLAALTSWRVVYFVSAFLMLILGLTLRVVLPVRKATTSVSYGELLKSTFGLLRIHAPLRRRSAYQFLMFGAFSVFWTTNAYVLTGPPFNFSHVGVGAFALVGAAGAAVAPLSGRVADAGYGRHATAGAFLVAVLAFVVAGIGRHNIIALALGAILLDMAVQTTVIVGQHTIYRLDPNARARLNSAFIAIFFVGGAVGSQAGSVAYHLGGWTAVVATGAVLPALGLIGWTTETKVTNLRRSV
jgi:predicted MFS family arabinose efflux permease